MYFKFQCPHCSKSLKVSEDKAGKKARCPYCHQSVIVPEPEPPQDDDRASVMSELLGDLAPPPSSAAESGPHDLPGRQEVPVAKAAKKQTKEKKPRGARVSDAGGEQFAQGTEVSLWRTGLYGLICTVWFYGLLWIIAQWKPVFFIDLFVNRGWIPYWETFFMAWSMAILLAKWHKFRRQKESMLFDVLPTELGQEIDQRNVDKFIEHVRSLPASPSESFLVNRVLRGLVHFKVRKSNPEVAQQLSSQSDIDATAVYSSYTLVKVFIWAIPILGFIGTVMGMSAAIGNFGGAMDKANELSALKESLGQIVGGLAVAFDTTFVALVMSLLITIPQNSLQKAEEDLLNWVDEYCNENLIKRLDDGGGQAMAKDTSPGGVAERIGVIQKDLAKIQESHVASLRGATAMIETHTQNVQQQLGSMTAQVELAVTGLLERTDKTQSALTDQTKVSAQELRTCLSELATGIRGLNDALSRLGQDSVIANLPKRRRGLFGIGRRSDNGV